jgi:nucleoside-diphosphate-sugar epimerase
VAGQVYFVGDHYPANNLFDFMEPYLHALGLPATKRSIPYPVAYAAACVAELVAPRSNLTRFSVAQTCVDHTYRHDKAERDLGYKPIVSYEEAFRRTLEYWKNKLAE